MGDGGQPLHVAAEDPASPDARRCLAAEPAGKGELIARLTASLILTAGRRGPAPECFAAVCAAIWPDSVRT